MSQGVRDLLSNRRFAVPLIALLAFCFIGLLLIGIVLIMRPGATGDRGAVAGATVSPTVTSSVPPTVTATPSPSPTASPTSSPTLVPVGTVTTEVDAEGTVAPTSTLVAAPGSQAEATTEPAGAEAEETVSPEDDEELAQTGLGWGLVLASGAGLAGLAIAARRLRLTV